MSTQRLLWRCAIALVSFELGLASAYFITVMRYGAAPTLLDFNGLRTLPSLLQAAHLFAIGGLCLFLLLQRSRLNHLYSWYLPLALACLCLFGGIDELTKLHLTFDQINWQLLYLGLLAAIPILSWRDLRWLWQTHRGTLLGIAVGMSIFLLGGFGAEFLKGEIAAQAAVVGSAQTVFWAEHLRIAIEEFAELLGETLILYAFAVFTIRMGKNHSRQSPSVPHPVSKTTWSSISAATTC